MIQPLALISALGSTWTKSGQVAVSNLGDDWHASVHAVGASPDNIFYDGFHVTYEGSPVSGKNPHYFFTGAGVYRQTATENHSQTAIWKAAKTTAEWDTSVDTAKEKAAAAARAQELSASEAKTARDTEVKRLADIAAAEAAQQAAAAAAAATAAAASGNSLREWLVASGKQASLASYHRGVANWRGSAQELAAYQAWCTANGKTEVQ